MPETLLRYAFGPFLLDPAERHLLRAGRAVALPPKALDVLAVLVTRSGHLVTKDELLEAAWPGVVVEENALSVAVSRLRTALGEAGRGTIETVPGHGYRFVAPVVALAAPGLETGYDGLSVPSFEDVVPPLPHSGDGAAPPVLSVPRLPMRPARFRRLSLFAGSGVLALLLLALLTLRGEPALPAAPPAAAHDPSPEALLAYQRGRALWESRRGDVMTEAVYQFRLATALDSLFAAGYVGEAQVYTTGYRTGPAAEAAITRALALDSTVAEAWATRGFVHAFQRWDWAAAEAAFARARALDPDDVTTLQWLASLRMVQRRLPEAEALLRRALALRPDYAVLHADLCEALYYRGAYAEAEAACARALALDPTHPMALAHQHVRLRLAGPEGRAETGRLLAETRAAPHPFDGYFLARLHARLGARDSALAYVEQAVAEQQFLAPFLHPDPLFDELRDDPRWRAAVSRMGLAEARRDG